MRSELPEDWRATRVGEIAEVVGGGTPKTDTPEYWEGEIPWLTPRDLRDHSGRYVRRGGRSITEEGLSNSSARLHPINTVLVSSRAPIGYVAIAANKVSTSQGFRSLILRDGVDPEFAYWVMITKTPEMMALAGGSTFKEISGKVLKTVTFPLPPLREQRAIAEVLGSLDDRIDWCRSTASDVLRALAAVAEGGANKTSVADLASYVNGGAFTQRADGGGRLIVRITELSTGVSASSKYTTYDARADRVAAPGDILFSWSATLDVFRWTGQQALVNQHIFKVIPERYPSWLVYAKLAEAMPEFQKIASDRATTMGHIKKSHLDQVMVSMHNDAELERRDAAGASLWEKHLRLHLEAQALVRTRDALLPEMVSGRLRLRDVEGFLDRAGLS